MNNSRRAGSVAEQSLSLSGMPAPSSRDLERTSERTLAAASRAAEAATAFNTARFASAGCSSSHTARCRLVTRSVNDRIDMLPSLAFVWPLELWLTNSHADDRREAFADVLAVEVLGPSP